MFINRSAAFVIIVLIVFACMAGNSSAQLQGTIKDVEQSWFLGQGGLDHGRDHCRRYRRSAGTTGKRGAGKGHGRAGGAGRGVPEPARSGERRSGRFDDDRRELYGHERCHQDRGQRIIQGAMVMDKKYMSDGSVEVTVGMKLTGALADTLLPKPPTPPTGLPAPLTPARRTTYTGLIVDARGLGVRPAMAPKVLNEDGKEVYGSAWINRDYAVREGMVGYLKDPVQAQPNPRVTDKPLMVKAVKASGDARVDMVITNADAAMLHSASQNLSMLEKCRVIILVD